MASTCNVCESAEISLVYESAENLSVTTMNKIIPGRTSIYFCECCGHLQTSELENLDQYYAEEYEINLTSKDDDQLYAIINDKPVYRATHQANTLMKKVEFKKDWRVLDYGCAKSATLKKVLEQGIEINPFMFDVTEKYIPFWQTFPKSVEWSTHTPNPAWNRTMDVVLSFYALEHVPDLNEVFSNIKNLLKPGGIFYFLVPNVYKNAADFIVADHVNHFSHSSLRTLMLRNGFTDIDIDTTSHDASFVVSGTFKLGGNNVPKEVPRIETAETRKSRESVLQMAAYWSDIAGRIQGFETSIDDGALAIYGAGFYGNFIATAMKDAEKITCFIDQNCHLQNTSMHNRPILSPDNIPAEVTHVLVGMNPRRARENIAQIDSMKKRKLNYFFM